MDPPSVYRNSVRGRFLLLLASALLSSVASFRAPTGQVPIGSRLSGCNRPNSASSTLHAVRRNVRYDADERRRQSLEQGNNPLFSLNLNLDSLAQQGAAPRAQELLERIRALYQEGYYDASPDTVSYNTVLKAWKEDDSPDRAYRLLQDMIDRADMVQVNVISFNTVILAYARHGNCRKAMDLLRQMKSIGGTLRPDIITYNSVLYAFAKSRHEGAPRQAEDLLKEMLDPDRSDVLVDATSFNTVIYAWAQAAGPSHVPAAQRAQSLLDHMTRLSEAGNTRITPDIYTYNAVVQAWARCERPDKAHAILESMAEDGNGPKPNRFTYTAVMSALAKSAQPERAQAILEEMLESYANGNFKLKPDTVSFSAVIDGWARMSDVRNPNAADRALELLQQMKSLQHDGMGPNAQTYTSILTAIAKSGRWDACDTAESLVHEMEDAYRNGSTHLEPTNIHWNAVLNAIARSPRADKAIQAERVLEYMKQHSRSECRPDIISYNSLLMACANAYGDYELKKKSFRVALKAFNMMLSYYQSSEGCNENDTHSSQTTSRFRERLARQKNKRSLEPTSTTFAHFCKSVRRLTQPPQRVELLKKTFRLCCCKGLVNSAVLQQVKMSGLTDNDWQEILEGHRLELLVADSTATKDSLELSHLPRDFVQNACR